MDSCPVKRWTPLAKAIALDTPMNGFPISSSTKSVSPDLLREDLMPYPDRARQEEIMEMANLLRYEAALQNVVSVLGPTLCTCEKNPECGLPEEAAEALSIAILALNGAHRLPPRVI
jgi:hypothetical protein